MVEDVVSELQAALGFHQNNKFLSLDNTGQAYTTVYTYGITLLQRSQHTLVSFVVSDAALMP
jgi:hypothetical protein